MTWADCKAAFKDPVGVSAMIWKKGGFGCATQARHTRRRPAGVRGDALNDPSVRQDKQIISCDKWLSA